MVFSSVTFLFYFLPGFLVLYFLAPAWAKNTVLLLCSLFFYAWGEPAFVLVLLLSIALNYGFGRALESARKPILIAGIATNLLLLGVFKYLDFLLGALQQVLPVAERWVPSDVGLALPLGISFFTFQSVSYLIDVYRKDTRPERNIVTMGAYIAMFPQLVAGPIVRYKTIVEDLHKKRLSMESAYAGIRYFVVGLAMKVLLADPLAHPADLVFAADPQALAFSVAWLGAIAYHFQIYFDFCGYSYMAIGLGLILGLRFPSNFNYPYISQSITEFWRRWHISLSAWFRDYLYIPLGGNRYGGAVTMRNLLLVFLLCGLWHGAAWNFVVWGLYQGGFLVIERLGLGGVIKNVWRPFRHLYVWVVAVIGWVIFRAEDMPHAWSFIQSMLVPSELGIAEVGQYFGNQVLWFFPLALVCATPVLRLLGDRFEAAVTQAGSARVWISTSVLATLFLWTAATMSTSTYSPFIYFRF